MLPALQLLVQVVVALGNLRELGIHTALQVDEILPSLLGVTRVLVSLANYLIEMSHRDLGHERLLDRTTQDGLDTGVTTHLLTNMVHDSHDGVLVPPLGILDRLNLTAHNDDLAGRNKLATTVCGAQMLRDPRRGDVSIQRLSQARNKLVALSRIQSSWRVRGQDKVAVQVNHKSVIRRCEE